MALSLRFWSLVLATGWWATSCGYHPLFFNVKCIESLSLVEDSPDPLRSSVAVAGRSVVGRASMLHVIRRLVRFQGTEPSS